MLDHQVSVGWLRTRLKNAGGDTGNWSSTGMVSQFTDTLLQNLHDGGFAQLDVRERILLLLSFLEIPLRNMDNLTDSVRDIIALADEDSNEWVKVAANIVKDYPTERRINTELGDILPCYRSTIEEVKREMSKSQLSYTASRLPKQCVYLNPTCLTQMCGPSPAPVKHFTLTRKPKSAALRAKITQKASDAANQRRISTTSSSNTKTNLKRTVSSQSASKMVSSTQLKSFSKSAMQKKTKILEIADQPLGLREQKKRKKVLALEALQEKQEKKKAERLQKQQMKSKKNEDEGDEEEKHIDVTSDAEEQEENQEEANVDDSLNSSQDDIAEPPEDNPCSPPQSPQQQQQEDGKPPAQQTETTPSGSTTNSIGPPPQLTRDPVYNPPPQPQQPQQSMAQMQHSKAAIPSPNDQLQREMQMRAHQEREMHMRMQQQRMFQQQMLQQQQQQCAPRMGMMSAPPPPAAMAGIPPPPAHQRMPPPHLQSAQTPNAMHPPTPGGQQKKGLSLTREQMLAAHEMFRSANRVTKAEKTLILGFMAGARENPFPQQGPIITIKLSEDAEQSHGQAGEPGQRMIVEMLFEMNYDTGHWRRLKRTRVVSQQQNPQQQQQQQSLQPPQHSQQQAQQQQQQMSQQMQQHQMQQHLQQQMQKQHFN